MGRAPCCDKANVKKGPWSPEEDEKLKAYMEDHGAGGNWIALPHKIGLKRCGKSCRLRWLNYLRPNIKHGGFTEEEDQIICNLYISIGSRWSVIAAQLAGRTDNDVKNYWNTKLKKKLLGACRRESPPQSRRLSNSPEQDHRQSSSQTLSSSALERLQLHLQLQGLNGPFSFYNNPLLCPKLHSLRDTVITDQAINGATGPPLITSLDQPAGQIISNDLAPLQINNNSDNNTNAMLEENNLQESPLMECFNGFDGEKESLSSWWDSNGFDHEKSSSSNSWDSANADLQPDFLFASYELDYHM